MKFSILWMVAIVGLVFELKLVSADDLWTHLLKKTFCQMIQRMRIYKTEDLDVHCVGKVDIYQDQMCVQQPDNLEEPVWETCHDLEDVIRQAEASKLSMPSNTGSAALSPWSSLSWPPTTTVAKSSSTTTLSTSSSSSSSPSSTASTSSSSTASLSMSSSSSTATSASSSMSSSIPSSTATSASSSMSSSLSSTASSSMSSSSPSSTASSPMSSSSPSSTASTSSSSTTSSSMSSSSSTASTSRSSTASSSMSSSSPSSTASSSMSSPSSTASTSRSSTASSSMSSSSPSSTDETTNSSTAASISDLLHKLKEPSLEQVAPENAAASAPSTAAASAPSTAAASAPSTAASTVTTAAASPTTAALPHSDEILSGYETEKDEISSSVFLEAMARQMRVKPERRGQRLQLLPDEPGWLDLDGNINDDRIKDKNEEEKLVLNPELWTVQDAEQVLQRMRHLAVEERRLRLKRQQQQQLPDGSCHCLINDEYVSKVDLMQNNVFDLAQDIVVDLGGEMKMMKQQHHKTIEDLKWQHQADMEELTRQHNETLAYFRHRMDRLETILNASQSDANTTRVMIKHVADDIETLSENVEDLSENVSNSTLLLNQCVKEHLGFPWFQDWYSWGWDILTNSVPAHSEFIRPANLGQWLSPQVLMMAISYALCHIISYLDARGGSKLSKTYKVKLGPVAKVGSYLDETKCFSFLAS